MAAFASVELVQASLEQSLMPYPKAGLPHRQAAAVEDVQPSSAYLPCMLVIQV